MKKYLVFSDLHGSVYYTNKILDIIKEENVDKVIILGDLYYHGPRNNLPDEYNPQEVARLLNNIKDDLIVIKGNCDAEVDEMISKFKFHKHYKIKIANKIFYFTHGHQYNKNILPITNFDVLMYGHFHTGFIEKKDGKIFANPGSVTLPKNNTFHSYIIIENHQIILKDINQKTLEILNY